MPRRNAKAVLHCAKDLLRAQSIVLCTTQLDTLTKPSFVKRTKKSKQIQIQILIQINTMHFFTNTDEDIDTDTEIRESVQEVRCQDTCDTPPATTHTSLEWNQCLHQQSRPYFSDGSQVLTAPLGKYGVYCDCTWLFFHLKIQLVTIQITWGQSGTPTATTTSQSGMTTAHCPCSIIHHTNLVSVLTK